ncbi:MAG: AbrB/MazE/SpoVT family DNA-binding domain-containing protein [Spirochaetales bacterium]|nr:AbrB/MazE/SpoVT family DNA-binding domain-containing protein [Spirochaetales bacterium]MCF7939294.1 AbrB/MazE/SpoVT family DNA-binding domain-containing protein [Spirochaetales bacterium]
MNARIRKWGNSQGIRLAKSLLKEADLEVGDEVLLRVDEGKVVLEPLHRVRGRYDLAELVAEIPAEYKPREVDWGGPAGNEVW